MTESTAGAEPVGDYREALRRGVPFRNGQGDVLYPTMRSRPYPSFRLDLAHRALLWISVAAPILWTVVIVIRIPSLPDQVPVHFSASGSVNRYGSPWEMLFLAGILLAAIIGCAVLSRYPQVYNYGIGTVTAETIQAHYRNSAQMMIWATAATAVIHIVLLGGIAGDWPVTPAIWVGTALLLLSVVGGIVRAARI